MGWLGQALNDVVHGILFIVRFLSVLIIPLIFTGFALFTFALAGEGKIELAVIVAIGDVVVTYILMKLFS